jgi:uncharacterized protein YggE
VGIDTYFKTPLPGRGSSVLTRHHRSVYLAGVALLASGFFLGSMVSQVGAQTIPGQIPGIVVTGFGTATAPATAAAVQVVIGPDFYGMGPPATLTDTKIAPIVDAVVAAGVARAEIEVVIPATTSQFSGPGAPGSAMLRFAIADPTDAQMNDLAQALYKSATDAHLGIQHIGVRYDAADCASLLQAATDAAVADARERAERVASSLGVEVGALIQAMDSGFYGTGTESCGSPAMAGYGPYGPGIDAPFDPSAPVEASATVQVTLTYEMFVMPGATPVSG